MPGPRNSKKQKKIQAKKDKKKSSPRTENSSQPHALPPPPGLTPPPSIDSISTLDSEDSLIVKLYNSASIPTLPYPILSHPSTPKYDDNDDLYENDDTYPEDARPSLPKEPFIHDPGNGPRVKDMNTFLSSPFAAPPSLDDPLCAEFAQEDLVDMLCQVLPEETALILWYNKSRLSARVCPACQRLYRLGDVLPDHLPAGEDGSPPPIAKPTSPYLYREQQISGICSPICFVLAAFHYPAAITSTFGRMAEELSDETWKLLDTPIDSKSNSSSSNEMGLGMLLKMSRCDDLGLGQLLFPDSESDPDTHDSSYDREHERSYEPDRARDHAYDIDRDDTPDSDSDYGSEVSVCGSDCSCRFSKGNYHKYHGEVEEEEERGRKRTRG